MSFGPSRQAALNKLDNFVSNGLVKYSELRNFDDGSKEKSNVSNLSPYISHGLINEKEIINQCLKKFSFSKNEKFIQEILWRIYWKGWLELRPEVWRDYLVDLNSLRNKFVKNENYIKAIEGQTNIKCFNDWVHELKENNYLHNHTRMWFASIWIFTLELPWQLGAEFFLKHLYDGDTASNTLGWRWVAGIQTKGKNYLATEWNIKKFTNNRYTNIKLREKASPIYDDRVYSVKKKDFVNNVLSKKPLLIFENHLSFETSEFKENNFSNIFLVINDNEKRNIALNQKVIDFKKNLFKDQSDRLKKMKINHEIINLKDVININENVNAIYPSVGENLDFLTNNTNKNLNFLYRKIDRVSLQYCNKGFFNFKNYIPKILESLRS